MSQKIKSAEFARRCHRNRSQITRGAARGLLIRDSSGKIDLLNKKNRQYRRECHMADTLNNNFSRWLFNKTHMQTLKEV